MFANAQQKKKLSNVYFLFKFSLKKLANNNSILTLTFSFKKKPQKVGLGTNGKLFFSFCFLIHQKKGLKKQIVFFSWTKTLWGLDQVIWRSWNTFLFLFVFFASGNKKTFPFLPLASWPAKKKKRFFDNKHEPTHRKELS